MMKLLMRWARAYARVVSSDGVWVYAPPLVIAASSPIWRAAPPSRIVVAASDRVHVPVSDPKLVAARRASLRLIVGSQSVS
jgi:hypothetical protein